MKIFAGIVGVLIAANAGLCLAGPKAGGSFLVGYTSHAQTAVAYGADYTSSGLSLGFDYQFVITENLSAAFFLVSSSESLSGGTFEPGTSAGHAILGLQGRFWVGDFFLGGHFGNYSEALVNSSAGTNSGGAGPGTGLIAGWEGEGPYSISFQYNAATVAFSDTDVELSGFRVHFGYRWGGKKEEGAAPAPAPSGA